MGGWTGDNLKTPLVKHQGNLKDKDCNYPMHSDTDTVHMVPDYVFYQCPIRLIRYSLTGAECCKQSKEI